jgi:hypothetical protein
MFERSFVVDDRLRIASQFQLFFQLVCLLADVVYVTNLDMPPARQPPVKMFRTRKLRVRMNVVLLEFAAIT